MWIISKIGAVISFKRNMAEKDVYPHARFVRWTVIFFCTDFLHVDDS